MVRGVLDKLITHLLVWSVHVWLLLEGGSHVDELEAAVLVEGGGPWVWQELLDCWNLW